MGIIRSLFRGSPMDDCDYLESVQKVTRITIMYGRLSVVCTKRLVLLITLITIIFFFFLSSSKYLNPLSLLTIHKSTTSTRINVTSKTFVIEENAKIVDPTTYLNELLLPVIFNTSTRTMKFVNSQQLWHHLDNVVVEQNYFLQRKLKKLTQLIVNSSKKENREDIVAVINEVSRGNEDFNEVLRDRLNELAEKTLLFRDSKRILERIALQIDQRIEQLQNGPCNKAIYCNAATQWGFASGIHAAAFCLIKGFQMSRRVEIDFSKWHYLQNSVWTDYFQPISNGSCSSMDLDLSEDVPGPNGPHRRSIFILPSDIANELSAHLRHPYIWWIGRFVKYLLRPSQQQQQQMADKVEKKTPFEHLAIHIRRGDKILFEADYHAIDEYMKIIIEHIKKDNHHHHHHPVRNPIIFISTDDPHAIEELERKYGKRFQFIHSGSSIIASSSTRDRIGAIRSIQIDLHSLSNAKFLVCTFSSGFCRLATELMSSSCNCDTYNRVFSLDVAFFYAYVTHPPRIALYDENDGVINETGHANEYLAFHQGSFLIERFDRSSIYDVKGRTYYDGVRIGRHLQSNTKRGNPYISWKTMPTIHVNKSWIFLSNNSILYEK